MCTWVLQPWGKLRTIRVHLHLHLHCLIDICSLSYALGDTQSLLSHVYQWLRCCDGVGECLQVINEDGNHSEDTVSCWRRSLMTSAFNSLSVQRRARPALSFFILVRPLQFRNVTFSTLPSELHHQAHCVLRWTTLATMQLFCR